MSSIAFATNKNERLRGALRVALYAWALALVFAALIARKVVADFSERTLAVGDELGAWAELIGPSTEVTLNGQQLFLGDKTLALPVAAVLDRFASLCGSDRNDPLVGLAASAPAVPSSEQALLDRLLVLRRDAGKAGAAACLAGASRGGLAGLRQRLERFARTHDLGAIGALRYVRASETPRGTHVIAVWSRGPLQLDALLPERGDVPGADFPDGARPTDAVRMLSAAAVDSEQQVNLYRSALAARPALDDYARALRARGFAPVTDRAARPRDHGLGRAYVKDGRAVLVQARARDGGSVLSVFELGSLVAPGREAAR